MVEVRFDSRETALQLRQAFVKKRKDKQEMGRLFLANNSVTLATRVRTDILRAIANQFSRKGQIELFVSAFNSRPVLHVIDKTSNNRSYTLTFVDALVKYGTGLNQENLETAYKRVGKSSRSQIIKLKIICTQVQNLNGIYIKIMRINIEFYSTFTFSETLVFLRLKLFCLILPISAYIDRVPYFH